jgi:branched-chain amino acid transport system permease protein
LLLGGMRTRLGPVLGAAAFALIEELVRPFGQLNVLVYGVMLIVLFVAFRDGMVPMLGRAFGASGAFRGTREPAAASRPGREA